MLGLVSEKIVENLLKISDNPSQYQRGFDLYIGGQTNTMHSGCSVQKERIEALNSLRIGSSRSPTADEPEAEVKKLVTQANTQVSLWLRNSSRVDENSDSLLQYSN